MDKEKIYIITRWSLIVLVSAVFLFMAYLQLTGKMSVRFKDWGYATWQVYLIGGLELLGVVGIYIKKTTAWATGILTLVAVGAVLTLVGHHEAWVRPIADAWKSPIPSIVVLLCMLGIMYLNVRVSAPPEKK